MVHFAPMNNNMKKSPLLYLVLPCSSSTYSNRFLSLAHLHGCNVLHKEDAVCVCVCVCTCRVNVEEKDLLRNEWRTKEKH